MTKDGPSLSITQKSCFIASIGLNFVGTIEVGKNVCSIRSKSRVSKLFVSDGGGALGGAVHACGVTREGVAVLGSTMVEGGISP